MSDHSFSFEFDQLGSTLWVTGELDDGSIEALVGSLKHSTSQAADLRVDLSEVTYLPSSAIGALVVAVRSAQDRDAKITLVSRSGSIAQRVLRVTGLPHEMV